MLRCVGHVRFYPRGLCVLWLTLRRASDWGNTAIFACFLYPYPDLLTGRIDALGLSHRRAPVAIGNDIQHRYRMLTVRHPHYHRSLASSPVAVVREAFIRPSVYSFFLSPVSEYRLYPPSWSDD